MQELIEQNHELYQSLCDGHIKALFEFSRDKNLKPKGGGLIPAAYFLKLLTKEIEELKENKNKDIFAIPNIVHHCKESDIGAFSELYRPLVADLIEQHKERSQMEKVEEIRHLDNQSV